MTGPPTVELAIGSENVALGAGAVTCKVPAAKVAELLPPDSAAIFTV